MSRRRQGLIFCLLAWATIGVSLWLPPFDIQIQLAVLSPLIFLLGVPHGALDTVFVRQLTNVRSAVGWSLFTFAYLAAAAAVVLVWWFSPGFFLATFLLISAFHFSGDPEGRTPALFRLLYGGAIIFCPLILHRVEVGQLFAALAGAPAAQAIVAALQWAAWPWLAAIVIAALAAIATTVTTATTTTTTTTNTRQNLARSIELLSLAALLTLTPPLIGFTIYFCAMHSARHVLRTRDYSRAGTWRHLLGVAAWPMLATAAGVAVAWYLSDGKPLEMRLVQLLFVGLAALTVPHMIVVERVRFIGWPKGPAEPD